MRQVEPFTLLPSGGALHRTDGARGLPLLFLHGVGGGAWSWRPQVAEFAPTNDCFIWEARGHGAAARVRDAGLGDYHTDAREALANVRAQTAGRIVIAGHSMGGLLALALAAREPECVAGLVLIDPVYPDAERPTAHDLGPLTPLLLALMKPLAASFLADGGIARVVARRMFAASFTDKERMEAAWPDQRRQVPIEYPRMLLEAFGHPQGFELRPFADSIDAPVLLVNARSRELRRALTRRLGARLCLADVPGGHYLQLDRPADVNERLRRFLRERVEA